MLFFFNFISAWSGSVHSAGVIITPLVLVDLGVGVGKGLELGVGLRSRQSSSDFNKGGNSLAGGQNSPQHRYSDLNELQQITFQDAFFLSYVYECLQFNAY